MPRLRRPAAPARYETTMNFKLPLVHCHWTSPLGPMLLAASPRGLAGAWFTEGQRDTPDPAAWPEAAEHPVLQATTQQLEAYFAGRRWGTTKLAPRISPNKTRAGAYGALVLAGAVALVGGWLLDERDAALLALLALALLTVLASILGDLIESLLKRQADVKDSGTLFPGHGGLLDRVDSVFSAVPVFVAGKAVLDLLLAS